MHTSGRKNRPLLIVEGVCASYGSIPVLHDVSLNLHRADTRALVGANKSGKSTLFKIVAGLIKPTSGKVILGDQDLTALRSQDIVGLGVVLVPEGRWLFSDMTVYENLLIGSHLPRARRERNSSLGWVYSLFPVLKERSNQVSATLSGGEQQQLAVARGLMSRPKILLLDEPTIGLDPSARRAILKVVTSLSEHGVSVLVAEQNIVQTLKVCSYTYILVGGRILTSGKSEEIMQSIRAGELPEVVAGLIT